MPAGSTGRELHIDVPLSNVVVGRRPEGFIADQLLPIVNVDKQSNIYYKMRHLEWFRHEAGLTNRAPMTEAKKVSFTVTSDTYYAKNYALGAEWPMEDEANADQVLQWAANQANYVTDRLMLDYESRIATLAVTSANVGTIFLASSGWNSAARTVLTDMLSWRDSFKDITGKMPNTMIIPRSVMSKLKVNDQLRDLLYGDRGGVVTAQQIGGLLEIARVLTPTAQVNTAVENDPQTGTFADMWAGNGHLWMGYIDTLGGQFTDTWAQAFRWTNPAFGSPMTVQRYPFDPRAKKYGIEVGYYQDEKIVSSDLMIRVSSLTAT
jgi:hypothetical protein